MTDVTIHVPASVAFILGRLKAIAAFLGALIAYATTVLPLPGDPHIWTGIALVLTFISVYAVPNVPSTGKRALLDENGEPVSA